MDILKYEKLFQSQGYNRIVGIDEAGRGPLAGPVVAVALFWGNAKIIDAVRDSKKISEKKRLVLFDEIISKASDIGIGIVHENEIDKINILQATYLAMRKAVGSLKIKPELLLVDGNKADIKHIKQKNIIKGDSLSYSIACASIIAKVSRDLIMIEYSKVFLGYGFEKHKGYGTKLHVNMIETLFSSPIHRKTFKPVKYYLPTLKNYDTDTKIHLLAKQLTASFMIKKGFKIKMFNSIYDVMVSDQNKLIIISVSLLIAGKTIDSKSDINGVNFNKEIAQNLFEYKLEDFKYFREDSAHISFFKGGPKFDIKKGQLHEF
tara:strand:- start:553 stop:1509 length:957 start_codon:yes stop_codon:yes gene_type:complete